MRVGVHRAGERHRLLPSSPWWDWLKSCLMCSLRKRRSYIRRVISSPLSRRMGAVDFTVLIVRSLSMASSSGGDRPAAYDRAGPGGRPGTLGWMDLGLTRRGDYAIRAALCLARSSPGDAYVKTREVASAMDLPASYAPHVLKLLASAGLAEAKAGPEGGYRLRSAPEAISLLAVVEAAEGPFRLERCILRGGPCHWEQACAAHLAWSSAVQACRESLEATTLADLVAIDERLRAAPGSALPGVPHHLGPRRPARD